MPKFFKNPWFLIVGLLIALLGIVIFIVVPAVRDIKNLNQKIIDQRTLLESRYEKRLSIKNAIRNFNSLQPQVPDLVKSIYLNPGNEIEFITSLEALADKNRVSQTVNFDNKGGDTSSQTAKKVPVEILLNGEYVNIVRYIQDLEKLDFYLIITSISAVPRANDPAGNIRTLLSGYTFWKSIE